MFWNNNYKKQFNKYRQDVVNKKYEQCDEQINYFYKYYKNEKHNNPNFNLNLEKSRLVFKLNNQLSTIIIFYFGAIISVLLCGISIYQNNLLQLGIILLSVSLVFFTIYKVDILNQQSDMWNRVLIALEKIEKEEELSINKLQEKQIEELKRIKEFLNI